MTYAYNADDNVTSFTQEYLGKELTARSGGRDDRTVDEGARK